METIEEVKLRKLAAEADYAKYDAWVKLNELNAPWYKSSVFIRSITAGLTFSLGVAAYGEFVFLPQQNDLLAKIAHSDFILIEKTRQHETELKKIDFLKQVALSKFELSQQSYKRLSDRYKSDITKNEALDGKLEKLESTCVKAKTEIKEVRSEIAKEKKSLNIKVAEIEEEKINIETVADVLTTDVKEFKQESGWIYLGYRPRGGWEYRTIDIGDDEAVEVNSKEYVLTKNVVLRSNSPRLSIFGYKFGSSKSYLESGEKVVILEEKTVGWNKVWGLVKSASPVESK